MSSPVFEFTNPFADPADAENASGRRSETRVEDLGTGPSPSTNVSRRNSLDDRPPRAGKKRVGFHAGEPAVVEVSADRRPKSLLTANASSSRVPRSREQSRSPVRPSHDSDRDGRGSHVPELSAQETAQIYRALSRDPEQVIVPPRPAIRQSNHARSAIPQKVDEEEAADLEAGPAKSDHHAVRAERARQAFERGKQLERDEQIWSEPSSRRVSPVRISRLRQEEEEENEEDSPYPGNQHRRHSRMMETDETEAAHAARRLSNTEAFDLVRNLANIHPDAFGPVRPEYTAALERTGSASSASTTAEEETEEYKKRPSRYRGGVLGALLKLHSQHVHGGNSGSSSNNNSRFFGRSSSRTPSRKNSADSNTTYSGWSSAPHSPSASGTTTPNGSHWYSPSSRRLRDSTAGSLSTLIGTASIAGSSQGYPALGEEVAKHFEQQQHKHHKSSRSQRPGLGNKRSLSANALAAINKRLLPGRQRHDGGPRLADELKITKHIAQIIQRQRYLLRLCKALMSYGAPTHRLEEYMTMSARVLEIEAQFLYIPGAMIMSFDDAGTHTAEVKLVKVAQGLDLGKLRDVHEVYKEVVHDRLGVEDATMRLKEIASRQLKFSRWVRIPFYGFAAVSVGPFAFGARLIDLPIAFFLGCIVGVLQLVIAPRSDLYANVFEISAAVITSFLARAFGSIRGGELFCFSALAQSSIALILPGYIVLCASLELQSRSIVAGSVRMVYAVIYSLILGFGITLGTALYGILDPAATSATTCADPMPEHWFFFFVPVFTLCLIIINQAKWKQAPVMLVVSFAGYLVNFFSSKRFTGNTQVANTLGALTIGVLANLYSRVGGRVENACLDFLEAKVLPIWSGTRKRIFGWQDRKSAPTTVEEGKSAEPELSGGFVPKARRVGYSLAAAAMLPAIFVQVPSGLAVGGSLVSGVASANQITGHAMNGSEVMSGPAIAAHYGALNSVVFNVAYSVIQVAIGITVGLFLSAIVVYPVGKRRSGLFSF